MHNTQIEIPCNDGASYYRIEENGKIRLILMPENRVILIGQLSVDKRKLLLFKTNPIFVPKSYTLGIPKELLENLTKLDTVAIEIRKTGSIYCASLSTIKMFGYHEHSRNSRQKASQNVQVYTFLDFKHWTLVDSIDEVYTFAEDIRYFSKAHNNYYGGYHFATVARV